MSTRMRLTRSKDDRRGARARRSPAPRLSIPTAPTAPEARRTCAYAQRRTSARTGARARPPGRAVSPVCTGDGCTIVLDGAVSQWKRSDGSSAAIGPPAGVAGRHALERLAGARARSAGSQSGASARQRGLVELGARGRGTRAGGENSTTPAFRHSPRSTRGTTRTIAYWKSSRAGTVGLLHPFARLARAARSRCSAYGAPSAHSGGTSAAASAGSRQRRQPRVGLRRPTRRRGSSTWSRIAGNGRRGDRQRVAGAVVHVQRGAVVDQPQVAVPAQQVRVARRAVDVLHQRVEPHDRRRQLRVGRLRPACRAARPAGSRRRGSARRWRGSGPGSRGPARRAPAPASSSTSTSSGTGSPSAARQLAGHDLGRERLRALAGAAELDHVQPVVVGLHDRGQRAALAQRGHVAGGGHRAQHGWHHGARCRRCCGSRPPSWSSGP